MRRKWPRPKLINPELPLVGAIGAAAAEASRGDALVSRDPDLAEAARGARALDWRFVDLIIMPVASLTTENTARGEKEPELHALLFSSLSPVQ